jgi:hypothetical protein
MTNLILIDHLISMVNDPPQMEPVNRCNERLYEGWCKLTGRVTTTLPVVWTEYDVHQDLMIKRNEHNV